VTEGEKIGSRALPRRSKEKSNQASEFTSFEGVRSRKSGGRIFKRKEDVLIWEGIPKRQQTGYQDRIENTHWTGPTDRFAGGETTRVRESQERERCNKGIGGNNRKRPVVLDHVMKER